MQIVEHVVTHKDGSTSSKQVKQYDSLDDFVADMGGAAEALADLNNMVRRITLTAGGFVSETVKAKRKLKSALGALERAGLPEDVVSKLADVCKTPADLAALLSKAEG